MVRRGSGSQLRLYRPDLLEVTGCEGPSFRLSDRPFRQMRGRTVLIDLVATAGPGTDCDTRRVVVWFHQLVEDGPEPVFESWQVRADISGRPRLYGPNADLPDPDPDGPLIEFR